MVKELTSSHCNGGIFWVGSLHIYQLIGLGQDLNFCLKERSFSQKYLVFTY